MANRIFLIVSVVIWIPYGLYCFFDPAFLQSAGVKALGDTGTTELRAMYGGLQIAIGVLAALALRDAARVRSTVLTLAILIGGIGTARALGALLAGDASSYTLGGTAFEFVTVGWAAWLLTRSEDGAALSSAG
jgi:hypothetical protein